MKIEYRKRFLKELSKIPSKNRIRIEKFVFEDLPNVKSISETGIIEQMKGYPSRELRGQVWPIDRLAGLFLWSPLHRK
jgi:mRNA-degrading endonuclease RelE of RelBE toxin-antitoxin system